MIRSDEVLPHPCGSALMTAVWRKLIDTGTVSGLAGRPPDIQGIPRCRWLNDDRRRRISINRQDIFIGELTSRLRIFTKPARQDAATDQYAGEVPSGDLPSIHSGTVFRHLQPRPRLNRLH
jgi:hypothetical protein